MTLDSRFPACRQAWRGNDIDTGRLDMWYKSAPVGAPFPCFGRNNFIMV